MVEQDEILKLHAAHTGVLDIHSDLAVTDKAELGKAYTPGVAVISKLIAAHPELKAKYTMSGKLVALITDGSAVLGLGNIGPAGGLPVVEGKALLYKNLAGINAIPLALNQVSVPAMVATIKNMSLSFAGIHLEDITAPKCFELEAALKAELDIPVYHDDQEGTAIVVLAGLINAAHVVGKTLQQMRIVVNGVGASGLATARLLAAVGVKQLTLVDVYGVVTADDQRYNRYQRDLAKQLGTPAQLKGRPLAKVMADQDVFIGLSDANVLSAGAVHLMNHDPIVFALANPVPEIAPAVAEKAGAAVIATGSSQYPNQVNNILAFPGLFKGLLANGVKQVDDALQVQVAQALAKTVTNPTATMIVPSVFDEQVVPNVTAAVAAYAQAQH
ncbi:NAD(P)-dependent malic enzyme [Lactiplantibacillus paraplantarum]|uniref:Malate dehydrogenase n=1 Tax=Lactiplantibacillus paraplantarum TaxID=60520 RepID=A0AAD0X784_9LACO|nr:malic enzyme-like NAD(P)-binding protein [Lactiplantibacillus paraplantarum]AVW09894.1 NADP-dependent malic enzyme [Lactiplantibacillus paraplantarum]AYJ38105.1 NADP-dependent malic enzyme [Lactiplantibacillus paraplantarum]ERL43151.1 malic enzyme, NAD-dependent [Lactiplantibacillus paraplantarum]KRL47714.1 malic enzyme, NAD-dependent [Lactiplantibacillus paraplantarum DSM 10667]MCU4683069.1 NADP-dependent malic enzyme [Lactiplantibacillus paraplantarum]